MTEFTMKFSCRDCSWSRTIENVKYVSIHHLKAYLLHSLPRRHTITYSPCESTSDTPPVPYSAKHDNPED